MKSWTDCQAVVSRTTSSVPITNARPWTLIWSMNCKSRSWTALDTCQSVTFIHYWRVLVQQIIAAILVLEHHWSRVPRRLGTLSQLRDRDQSDPRARCGRHELCSASVQRCDGTAQWLASAEWQESARLFEPLALRHGSEISQNFHRHHARYIFGFFLVLDRAILGRILIAGINRL